MIIIRCRSFAARGSHAIGPERQKTFRFVASWFYDVRSYDWDLLVSEVSGDLTYTVAIDATQQSRNGRPPAPTELPVTHVYRREDSQWRAVHRDLKPPGQPAAT